MVRAFNFQSRHVDAIYRARLSRRRTGADAAVGFALHRAPWRIAILFVLSALFAGTQSFDAPARQSWVPLLVPREYVGNAIGLNSIAFNAPSVIGPPIAGFLIAASGVAPSFYVNAVSTLAVVIALFFMKPSPASAREREPFLRSVSAGVTMLYRHPVLRYVVLLLIVTSLLVRPTGFLLPAYAAHQLHVDARGLGWLMAATGIGAIIGAVATAAFTGLRRSGLWFASGAVMSASVAGRTQPGVSRGRDLLARRRALDLRRACETARGLNVFSAKWFGSTVAEDEGADVLDSYGAGGAMRLRSSRCTARS